MSSIQQTVVLDLSTSNILISVLSTIDQLIQRLFISKAIREYKIQRGIHKIPFIDEKIEMGECSSMQQFTHPVHPKSSFRLSHLLRQFLWAKREKYDRQGRQKYNERKNKQQ